MIKLQNVSKTFTTKSGEVNAVKDVSIDIASGEIYGIIGFSGAGKSTLVRCINLLEVPTEGQVIVDNQDLTRLSVKELRQARKNIGMIFQQFNLMASRTVAGNIAYPLKGSGLSKEAVAKKVQGLLELVGLEDRAKAYPSQLSGGQKQRVAIARALASDPKVLLCDEATSALDPQTTKSILQLLRSVNEQLGITIVLITHEMAVVKEICQKVAVMEDGKVVEEGDVFSIFSDPQQNITKDFIKTTSNLQQIDTLIADKSPVVELKENELILKFTYVEKTASDPLVSYISRAFDIDVNILFGDIEIIQNASLGGLVVVVSGERQNISNAVTYMIEKNVRVEVLADGRNRA